MSAAMCEKDRTIGIMRWREWRVFFGIERGCPQQAKRAAGGGGAGIGISERIS